MTDNKNYGYIKEGNVYLSAYMEFSDRLIGVVKDSEEASIKYFADRFEKVQQKIADVATSIEESANKGSYLMKLIHMRTYLATYNGLGDFELLFKQIDDLESSITDYIAKNRIKNQQIKTGLLLEAKELENSEDWEEASETFKELKMRWIRTGSTGQEEEKEICDDFDRILNDFFARRKEFYDTERNVAFERTNQYYDYIRELARINRKDEKSEFRERVIEIQRAWKDIGKIDKWKYLKIWKRYKQEIDTFFGNKPIYQSQSSYQSRSSYSSDSRTPAEGGEKRTLYRSSSSSNQEQRPLYRQSSEQGDGTVDINRKKELCIQVEEIVNSWKPASLSDIKTMQAEWKRLGIIQNDDEDKDLNNRFRSACNEIFELSSLNREVASTYEGFEGKTSFEQLKLKIKLTKELIKTGEVDLANVPNPNQNPYSTNRDRLNYINKINKIKTQKRILRRLQQELTKGFY